jgi:hypothetical protein
VLWFLLFSFLICSYQDQQQWPILSEGSDGLFQYSCAGPARPEGGDGHDELTQSSRPWWPSMARFPGQADPMVGSCIGEIKV